MDTSRSITAVRENQEMKFSTLTPNSESSVYFPIQGKVTIITSFKYVGNRVGVDEVRLSPPF